MADLDIATVIETYRSSTLTVEELRTLAGERARAGQQLRAIVVDNASGDLPEIEQAVARHGWGSWVSLVAAPRNGGFAYGNNLGIAHARASCAPSYVYLLNPDAQVRPHAVEILVRFLETHPAIGIAGSGFDNLDGSDWPIAFRFPTLWSELDQGLGIGLITRMLQRWVVARRMSRVTQRIDWVCGASMLIRPAVLDAIGGFDENYFLYYEETDFCRRALQAGFETWYVPESRVMDLSGQSTRVTERGGRPRRLPAYWFESRRRYFAMSYGLGNAIAIDFVAVCAHSLGLVKRVCQGRRDTVVPQFIRDLIRHSALWRSNRMFPAAHCGAIGGGPTPQLASNGALESVGSEAATSKRHCDSVAVVSPTVRIT